MTAAIVSPCTKVCVIDRTSRLCIGCLRSIDEIGAWSRMTPAARDAVMADLDGRSGLIAPQQP